jgi:hypothetical protein
MVDYPGWSVNRSVWCARQAIPPEIFKTMVVGGRYHVQCNIGAEKAINLCFNSWEPHEDVEEKAEKSGD